MPTLAICLVLGIGGICFMIALTTAARRGKPTSDPLTDSLVFHYTGLLRLCSFGAALGLPAAITIMVMEHPPQDMDDTIAIAIAYVVIASLLAPLVWDVARFRLVVSEAGLDCRSPWHRRRFIPWDDVRDVSFNNPFGWFNIRTRGGPAMRVPALVAGLGEFLDECERRLSPRQLKPAWAAYIYLGRPLPREE